MAHSTEKRVTCPACKGISVFGPSNPYRPFCSGRCKGIDLGAWANEEFRLPATEKPDDMQPEHGPVH